MAGKLDELAKTYPELSPWAAALPDGERSKIEAFLSLSPEVAKAELDSASKYQDRLFLYRDFLVKTHYEVSVSYDKTLLTVATGALALSVALVNALAPASTTALVYLKVGWGALVGSIVALLSAMWASRISLRHAVQYTDALIASPSFAFARAAAETPPQQKRHAERGAEIATVVASVLLCLGVVALVLFAARATPKERSSAMSGARESGWSAEERSYVPPPPPPPPAQPSQQQAPAPAPTPAQPIPAPAQEQK